MRYTHRPGFCSWMQWFFFFSSGGSLSSLFQCSGGTSSLLSSLFSLIVSVETDSWTVNVCKGGKDGREERGTAHSDPHTAPLHGHPPPPDPPSSDSPGWKFLVCGPNSKIPNVSSSTTEQQHTDSHTHTHAANPPPYTHMNQPHTHTGRDPTWFHLNSPPTACNFLSLFFPPPQVTLHLSHRFQSLALSIPFIRLDIYSLGEAGGMQTKIREQTRKRKRERGGKGRVKEGRIGRTSAWKSFFAVSKYWNWRYSQADITRNERQRKDSHSYCWYTLHAQTIEHEIKIGVWVYLYA